MVFKTSANAAAEGEHHDEIAALVSREGEKVELVKSIFPHDYRGNVE